jgi:hypothetical protein
MCRKVLVSNVGSLDIGQMNAQWLTNPATHHLIKALWVPPSHEVEDGSDEVHVEVAEDELLVSSRALLMEKVVRRP